MKKYVIFLLAAAAAALACTKEVVIEASVAGQTVFSGTCPATKVALGDKTGENYPALWENGDRIDVFDASSNALIGTADLDAAYAGQQTGRFVLDQAIADGTSVKIVYPAGSGFSIPAEQTRDSAGDRALLTRAESAAVAVSGGAASFTLAHQNAVIQVNVSSSEFAGRLLKSVTLYAKGAALSADGDYVRVTFTNPTAISADGTVSAVFSALPVATAQDFYVAVKLIDPSDALDMVCIPKLFSAKPLSSGKVTTVNFTGLVTSDNDVAWYNPVCRRYIPEGGWCYGESSTVVVAPTVNSYVNFDVRAVGEFIDVIRYAAEPKAIQLRCGDIVDTGTAGVWSIDGTTPKKNAYAPINSYAPKIVLAKAISNSKKTVAGLLNLCDGSSSGAKVLWSYVFWGAAPGETAYDNGTVMNMNLGGSSADGKAAEQRGTYYQWGRPFAFGYGSALQTVNTSLRITSYAISAANAFSLGVIEDKTVNTDWWQDGTHKYDLWGNPETATNSAGGVKSIFDPCPKGWKVAPATILKEVLDKATFDATNGWYTYKGDVWCASSFYSGETATRGSDSKGLYWADNAPNDNHGLHYEFIKGTVEDESQRAVLSGTWRANACAVRCVKDADNR